MIIGVGLGTLVTVFAVGLVSGVIVAAITAWKFRK